LRVSDVVAKSRRTRLRFVSTHPMKMSDFCLYLQML
jgi:hypothetical protein